MVTLFSQRTPYLTATTWGQAFLQKSQAGAYLLVAPPAERAQRKDLLERWPVLWPTLQLQQVPGAGWTRPGGDWVPVVAQGGQSGATAPAGSHHSGAARSRALHLQNTSESSDQCLQFHRAVALGFLLLHYTSAGAARVRKDPRDHTWARKEAGHGARGSKEGGL